jgi:uncharacterized protein (UPF0332 family)
MKGTKKDLIKYRLSRSWDTLDDAKILALNGKWNSSVNRLYYSVYYAVTALLLFSEINSNTHSGTKSLFSQEFVKKGIISKDFGKLYSQLFTWRQKGDYDDLFDFNEDKVVPYFEPVQKLIEKIEEIVNK